MAGKLLHCPFLQLAVCRRDDPVSYTKIHLSGAGGASESLRYCNLVVFHVAQHLFYNAGMFGCHIPPEWENTSSKHF